MTQDDVIDMARQAGMEFNQSLEEFSTPFCDGVYYLDLETFAKLAFEKGRQQGMQQERALWQLSKSTQEIGL